MARKSRIHKTAQSLQAAEPIYQTALYVRASVFNGGKENGDTIENQEDLLRSFIADKPQLVLTSVYIDNGESGVNFNRNAFEQLLNDIKAEKVNCIVVKDLSRFGRNYLETGEYLETIFPLLGVRFITVNDHYDSKDPTSADVLSMHLRNLVNDVYARDISRKICPVLRSKQERGEFIGAWAPFGYKKSKEHPHKLEVDEDAAPIVRDMFRWRQQGWSCRKIAQELNERQIPSPSRYRYQKGIIKDEKLAKSIWKPTTVVRLLSNQEYLGYIVHGKKRAALWNGQLQIEVPRAEWIVIPDCHQPLIDEDMFQAVQAIAEHEREKRKSQKREVNTFVNPESEMG